MMELWQHSIHWTALPFTTVLAVVALYWIIVILGVLDLDSIDFMPDVDLDIDGDVDVDGDVSHGPFMSGVAFFFGVDAPFMVPFSIFAFVSWMLVVLGNYYWNTANVMGVGLGLGLGAFLVGLFITKYLSAPFHVMFRKMEAETGDPGKMEGRMCTVLSPEIDDTLGQCEVEVQGAPVLLNVRHKSGAILKKGDEAVVLERDEESGAYWIKSL